MIRSSSHSLQFANRGKKEQLFAFLAEYRRLLSEIIDSLWEKGICMDGIEFSISQKKLQIPTTLPNNYLKQLSSWFSARMKQCVGKQACAMVKAAVKKRAKQLYMLRLLQQEQKDTKYLQRKIDLQPLVKPNAENARAEMDSRFVDFQAGKCFDFFVRIKQLGNGLSFNLPIKGTKVSQKWLQKGKLKKSIRLCENSLVLFYEVEKAPYSGKKKVGGDQGYKTVLSLSDGQQTKRCRHGHELTSIQKKLARRQKGSKGFKRAQKHRENYINWSLNQFNYLDICELRLERVIRLRYKKSSSRVMSHWTYTRIKTKLESLGETEGFRLKEMPNEFRSQRCSRCGWVRKANRKGKTFKCNVCGFTADADLNAASNLELDLFQIPSWVRLKKINRQGFYWNSDGLFDSVHEPIVREAKKVKA